MSTATKPIKATAPSDLGTVLLRWLIAFLVILAVTRVDAAQQNQELQRRAINMNVDNTSRLRFE